MKNRKNTSTKTSNNFGRAPSNVPTMTRIPFTLVIVRSGRNTLALLIALKLSTKGKYARRPSNTTQKSIRFQLSAKYAPGWPTNPRAIIFKHISNANSAVNKYSE
eukprot:30294-Pelagococcus_subviridis.AAC.102